MEEHPGGMGGLAEEEGARPVPVPQGTVHGPVVAGGHHQHVADGHLPQHGMGALVHPLGKVIHNGVVQAELPIPCQHADGQGYRRLADGVHPVGLLGGEGRPIALRQGLPMQGEQEAVQVYPGHIVQEIQDRAFAGHQETSFRLNCLCLMLRQAGAGNLCFFADRDEKVVRPAAPPGAAQPSPPPGHNTIRRESGRHPGTAPRGGRRGRSPFRRESDRLPAKPPGEVWRGRSPSACPSYPAASPPGRVVFRSAENFPYSLERPGAKRPARGCKLKKVARRPLF